VLRPVQADFRELPAHPATTSEFKQLEFLTLREGSSRTAGPGVQYWTRALAFEHGNLLSKGKDFKGRVASALAEDANDRDHGQDEFTHKFPCNTA
jgi:hypothetical protein